MPGISSVMSTSAPATFQDAFDVAFPDYMNSAFGNNGTNDCVIAARAHHTIRLTWMPGAQILAIADKEVREEFLQESGGLDSGGLELDQSLLEWQTRGWTAGGVSGRTIDQFGALDVGAIQEGDASSDLTWDPVKSRMVEYGGIQAQFLLPTGIRATASSTFGPQHPWTDTRRDPYLSHTMLLAGYDLAGPVGITWGQKQNMSWTFLQAYCVALYWIQKGDRT